MKIIKRIEQDVIRDDLIYKTSNKKDKSYDFEKFKTIRYSERKIYNGIITLNIVFEEQINLNDKTDNLQYLFPIIDQCSISFTSVISPCFLLEISWSNTNISDSKRNF